MTGVVRVVCLTTTPGPASGTRPARADRAARADRDRSRGLAHDLLAREVGAVAVRRLCPRCASSEHGRPFVVTTSETTARTTGTRAPHVSLSYAAGLVVVAWTEVAPVGVDVEHAAADTPDTPGTADDTAGPGGPDAGVYGDLATWTRAEALLKATGEGLARDPAGPRGLPRRWVRPIDLGPGRTAHVALDLPPDVGPAPRVEIRLDDA